MKNLFFMMLLSLLTFSFANAQNNESKPTPEDYERMIRASENLEFREYAIKSLGLTREQIVEFDPLYRRYMREKNQYAQKKFELLEDYVEEIQEDDSAKNEEEDLADFIENYWEVEIVEMELRKDYFDKLEDKIGTDDAFGFFMLEDVAENKVQQTIIERRYIPIYIEVEKDAKATGSVDNPATKDIMKQPIAPELRADIKAYSDWVESGKGKVGLHHDYTHDGLHSLVGAITALSSACDDESIDLAKQSEKVNKLASKLQVDPYSDKHADYAREAFVTAADMLRKVQKSGDFTTSNYVVTLVEQAAEKINPDELLIPQSEHIRNFFQKSQMAINSMSDSVTWASK